MKITSTTSVNVILACIMLTSILLVVTTTSQGEYDPWVDLNDDGWIELSDFFILSSHVGTSGTPINKTALLLELEARIDALNATVISLKQCIVVTGSKPYNAPTAYTSGTGFVIDVSGSIPSGFTLVSTFATGRKTDLGGSTLDEPPLSLLPRVSGTYIEIRVWDFGGDEYDNWSSQRAHIDYTLFITK